MSIAWIAFGTLLLGQTPAAPAWVSPTDQPSIGRAMFGNGAAQPSGTASPFDNSVRRVQAEAPVEAPAYGPGYLPAPSVGEVFTEERRWFESDREFEGFIGPLSNPIQFKDPRSLTEARFLFLNNYGNSKIPVLGKGSFQVYALQLRLAVTDRLQLFADKDGIVRFSPAGGKSVTGLANINAGAKYVLYRDVENQTLFSVAAQYEPPTGYANVFQNQGAGLLGITVSSAPRSTRTGTSCSRPGRASRSTTSPPATS